MIEQWQHGCLYAVTPDADPLAYPVEPYLAVDTGEGWRFLYAPDYITSGDGPHPISPTTQQIAIDQGFDLPRADVLALWSERDAAILQIARSYGLVPAEPGVTQEADDTLRAATPGGRLSEQISSKFGWSNSTIHVHTTRTGAFKSATMILRVDNPYQARFMLIALGAQIEDIRALTQTDY